MTPEKRNWFHCPPYASERWTATFPEKGYVDVAPIRHISIWNSVIGDREIDWKSDHLNLWRASRQIFSDGSEFSSERVGLEIEVMFSDASFSSIGVAVDCRFNDFGNWTRKAATWMKDLCGDDKPFCGLIGVLSQHGNIFARPCVTMLVSGPRGGTEAAQIIRQGLIDRGMSRSIVARGNRLDTVGIIKIPFLPEIYTLSTENSFGIDWQLWKTFFMLDKEKEWNAARLLWCDAVNFAISDIRAKAGLMIDKVFYDEILALPINPNNFNSIIDTAGDDIRLISSTLPFEYL